LPQASTVVRVMRIRSAPFFGLDGLVALVVAAIQIVGTHFASLRQPERMDLDAAGLLLLALGPAALVARRRHPVAVLWFALAATLGYLLLDYPRGQVFLALIVALVPAV
jgi:hypothetical protein